MSEWVDVSNRPFMFFGYGRELHSKQRKSLGSSSPTRPGRDSYIPCQSLSKVTEEGVRQPSPFHKQRLLTVGSTCARTPSPPASVQGPTGITRTAGHPSMFPIMAQATREEADALKRLGCGGWTACFDNQENEEGGGD